MYRSRRLRWEIDLNCVERCAKRSRSCACGTRDRVDQVQDIGLERRCGLQLERHGLTIGEELLAMADDDGMHQQVQLVDFVEVAGRCAAPRRRPRQYHARRLVRAARRRRVRGSRSHCATVPPTDRGSSTRTRWATGSPTPGRSRSRPGRARRCSRLASERVAGRGPCRRWSLHDGQNLRRSRLDSAGVEEDRGDAVKASI